MEQNTGEIPEKARKTFERLFWEKAKQGVFYPLSPGDAYQETCKAMIESAAETAAKSNPGTDPNLRQKESVDVPAETKSRGSRFERTKPSTCECRDPNRRQNTNWEQTPKAQIRTLWGLSPAPHWGLSPTRNAMDITDVNEKQMPTFGEL